MKADKQGNPLRATAASRNSPQNAEDAPVAHHPGPVTARNNPVMMHYAGKKRAENETLLEEALLLWKQRWGGCDLDIAASLSNLAEIHHAQGNLELAAPLFLRALNIREKALGAESSRDCCEPA